MHSINLTQLKEINTLVKHSAVREKNPLVTHYKRPINFQRFTNGELCLLIMLSRFESMYIFYFSGITHLIILFQWPSGADLGGGCNSCAPPPPPPEMTCGFLIQLVFCKKKNMWIIGVEVKQETSAPPPKKKSWIRPWPSLSRKKIEKKACIAGVER